MQDRHGRTALFRAVSHSHLEVVRWLLQLQANANISDSNGTSPLHVALQRPGQPELAQLLLQYRASADTTDYQQRTPLHVLAGSRKQGEKLRELASLLLQQNPQLHTHRDMDGWTPLHEAALSGNLEILELLLEQLGCGIDIEVSRIGKLSSAGVPDLLHLAVMGKRYNCIQRLLDSQAAPGQDAIISWTKEFFRISHHYTHVGLGLMGAGILAKPFDRISFDTMVSSAQFSRNLPGI